MKKKIKSSDVLIPELAFCIIMNALTIARILVPKENETARLVLFILILVAFTFWLACFTTWLVLFIKEAKESKARLKEFDKEYKHVETLEIYKLKNEENEENGEQQ